MTWNELEQFVVNNVNQHCQGIIQTNAEQFAQQLQAAYSQLGPHADYNLPLTGEAYAFKYHLQRMDNVGVALEYVHRIHPLLRSQNCHILDMGAGNGCSAMAALNWASQNLDFSQQTLSVRCAEPAPPMRSTAEVLLPQFCGSGQAWLVELN